MQLLVCSPDVKRGNCHEEDGRARRVDVLVHPSGPRRQHLAVRLDAHHLVVLLPALPARPPASDRRPHVRTSAEGHRAYSIDSI